MYMYLIYVVYWKALYTFGDIIVKDQSSHLVYPI